MSNLNKHKPLSPEELFELLDKQSSNETTIDGMDDFEKEALEGFTAYSSPEKAKALTEELNRAISKKVGDVDKGSSKNKVIWFSAAASIVFFIMISVFFLYNSKEDTQTNLALNETKEELNIPIDKSNQSPNETIVANQGPAQSVEVAKNEDSKTALPTGAISVAPTNQNRAVGDVSDYLKDDRSQKEEVVSTLQEQPITVAETSILRKKDNAANENEEFDGDKNVNLETNSNSVAQGGAIYKSDADTKIKNESAKKSQKQKTTEKASDQEQVFTKTTITASAVSTSENSQIKKAYYNGGEEAIKEFVLNYLKQKAITKSLVGKYKIVGLIDTKGVLKVLSITQITKEFCGCSDEIKEALNAMTRWNPAIEGTKAVTSNVDFTLSF